jgi:phosphoglucosamine mutase
MDNKKLFGTDGIRRRADAEIFKEQNLRRLALALEEWIRKNKFGLRVIIGRDTRESSPRIANSIKHQLENSFRDVMDVGIIPTPGLAYLSNKEDCIGIMITASHNSMEDNGIKIFLGGRKLSDRQELEIEDLFFSRKEEGNGRENKLNNKIVKPNKDYSYLKQGYVNWLLKNRISSLRTPLVVFDCAHGAVSQHAEEVLKEMFPTSILINNKPDGDNINENSGAIAPQGMARLVRERNADLGVAFDGDGDRAVFCDEKGNIVDGDQIIAFLAKEIGKEGVVFTEYSNKALDNYLEENGINYFRVECGDKKVANEMIVRRLRFGGEESGHYIFSDNQFIGDGMFSAIKLIKILTEKGMRLSELKLFEPLPKVKLNQKVKEKRDFNQVKGLSKIIKEEKDYLGKNSRIFLRYSGTEDKARILVEGEDKERCERSAQRIAKIIDKEIGES